MLKKSSPHLRRMSFVPGCGDKPGCRKQCNQWRSRSDWCIGCTVAVFFCKFNVVVLRPNKTQQNLQGLSERTCHKMKQTTSRIWLVLEETPWIRRFFQDSAAADLMSRIGVFMSAKVWKHHARNKNGSVLQVFNFHICYTEPYCTLKEGELKLFFHVHQTDECRNSGASLWGNMSSSKCEWCSDGHLEMSIEKISSIDLMDVFLETKLYLWLEDAWRVADWLVYVRDWHKNNKTSVGITQVLTTRFLLSTSSRTDLPAQFVKATLLMRWWWNVHLLRPFKTTIFPLYLQRFSIGTMATHFSRFEALLPRRQDATWFNSRDYCHPFTKNVREIWSQQKA